MTFSECLKKYREKHGLTQEQLADMVHTTKQVISNYERGTRVPKISAVYRFAEEMGVPLSYFSDDPTDSGLSPVTLRPFRRLGTIRCGEPVNPGDPDSDMLMLHYDGRADFVLTAEGDSMAPGILSGDIVFIRSQPDVENGQIAAVMVDGSATLKKVYHIPGGLLLAPENPAYQTITVTGDHDVRIVGLAVAFQRTIV